MPRARPDQPVPGSKGTTLDMLRDRGVTADPLRPRWRTPRPDAWTSMVQDKSTYLTTTELAEKLNTSPPQVVRWCKQWFGELPPARQGVKGQGYRIPPEFLYVGRVWRQTQDKQVREAAWTALQESPRDFLVVVANRGSTHYSEIEARRRVEQVLPSALRDREPVSVYHAGPNSRSK